jgi:transmembrane sensor
MSTRESPTQISNQTLEEACDWFIDLNEGELDTAGRKRLNQWLRRSPEHVQAYLEIAAAWEDSSRLKGAQSIDPATLVAEGLAERNVVRLDPRASQGDAPWRENRSMRPWLFLAVAASTLLAVGIGLLSQHNAYTTGIGEERSIVLADGSAVELDARSRLRVRFSHTERMVELMDGQALFRVKKEAARPFIVLSNGTRARAVGTQFDVYRKATGTTVTVLEGRVAVTEAAAAGATGTSGGGDGYIATPIVLSAGEQVTLTPHTVPHAVPANLAAATAWTQRKLAFDETPLSEVVAEFNRYNARQMTLEDPSLGAYHIRGNFEATDPDRLLQFLRARFDADVREHGNEILISRK